MTRRPFLLLTALLLPAAVGFAADATGKWTAQVPGRDGQMREQVYNLKADGDKLTGTVSMGQAGEAPIADGKVSGDTISFTLTREFGGNTIKWTYHGVVSGDEIKFKREGGQGPAREFVAKRSN
jgi:hypothetical protein